MQKIGDKLKTNPEKFDSQTELHAYLEEENLPKLKTALKN
jgi:hypothetical protein